MLLREQSLLWQWGNIEKVPAGAGTAAAVKKTAGGDSCGGVGLLGKGEGMGRCGWWKGEGGDLGNVEGRGREEKRLLLEQALLRQWGNTDSAPAGADTAAAVGKYRERSCGSRHYCGSGEIQIALLREQSLLRQ